MTLFKKKKNNTPQTPIPSPTHVFLHFENKAWKIVVSEVGGQWMGKVGVTVEYLLFLHF